jgi:hypothetical protein
LETGALPIELLAFVPSALGFAVPQFARYFCSRCGVCFRQNRQNLLNSSRSVVFFLFFDVL